MVTEQKHTPQSEQVCTNAVQTKVRMCVCAEISPQPLFFIDVTDSRKKFPNSLQSFPQQWFCWVHNSDDVNVRPHESMKDS